MNRASSVQVNREGEMINIPVKDSDLSDIMKSLKTKDFISEAIPCVIDSIVPNSPAYRGDLKKGDRIFAVNQKNTELFHHVQREIRKNKNQKIPISVLRGSDTLSLNIEVSENGTVGFFPEVASQFETKKVNYSITEAIPAGISEGYEKVVMQVKQFAVLFTVKDAHESIGGFYTMTKNLPSVWDWQGFWSFTAFLSMVLAFMNFLPIPALDGGHVIFLLYEIVTRKKPSEKFLMGAQYVGMILLLSLMLYANLDWLRD
jgi:regulator of sigma E protease